MELPAFTFCHPPEQPRRKSQTLNFSEDGFPEVRQLGRSKVLPVNDTQENYDNAGACHACIKQTTGSQPVWLKYDRQVLRFYGYFKEQVDERVEENHRYRKCTLYYYLADGQMHISEPKERNSGMPQLGSDGSLLLPCMMKEMMRLSHGYTVFAPGVFLKKQKIPNGRGGWMDVSDFHLGKDVTIFGHCFHIIGCDVFTRVASEPSLPSAKLFLFTFVTLGLQISIRVDKGFSDGSLSLPCMMERYLMKARLPVGDEEPWPNEPLEEYRAHYRHVITPHIKEYALRQFLDLDGKVLRFFCVWDDRAVPYGERRPYILHYFLGDDTIEILELNERNNGRMPSPMLIKRQKLPKETPHEMLSQKNMAGILTAKPKASYYRDTDLHIGSYIRIFDRDMLLHDVDEFTRNYYRKKYGYTEDMLAPVNVQEQGPILARMPVPEHNGFGSEADSYMNCISLIPKAPPKDFYKFIYKDGKMLTFTCKIIEDATHKVSVVDKTRSMIFQYYLSDDTVSVFEPPARNSGCTSGRFLARLEAPRKPGTKRPYQPNDCYMGAKLELHERLFELLEADEWTLKYMENDPKQFPFANYEWVSNKLRCEIAGLPDRRKMKKRVKTEIGRLPADKKGELKNSIKGPSPPASPPPKSPCSPPPPVSPCGNRCAEMATPPLSPKRPCDKSPKPPQSPPSWPASPPKSPPVSPRSKPVPIQALLAKFGINITKQEVCALERYVNKNKGKFGNIYSLVKSFF